jgi:alkylation response protein AidB-like acyl-CoA dehydrogenase
MNLAIGRLGIDAELAAFARVALALTVDYAVPEEQVGSLRLKLAGLYFILGER